MKKKTVRDFDLKGKRVLVRVDFNVPLDKELRITDDNRIKASLPTIQYALDKGAKVVLMSHLGRPDGKRVSSMSLSPAAIRLAELLKQEVLQCSDCVGPTVQEELKKLDQNGVRVALLENLRFYPEEEKNDPGFAKQLAQNGQLYVNDAFGSSHRAHASIDGVTKFLPAGAGFLLEKEIEYLGEAVQHPKKPFVAILGGSKVSDKIGVIENLIDKVDKIIIGGAMAYTFMKVKGLNIGRSRFEKDKLELAKQILEKAAAKKVAILTPLDNVAVERFDEKAPTRIVENGIPDGWEGVDIGPKTAKLFRDALDDAKTVVWNGPMGVFEMKPFAKGSLEVAEKLAEITAKGAVTVIGGGDTAACVIGFGLDSKMTHISTGGGASLEYLEGKCLPGIAALQDR